MYYLNFKINTNVYLADGQEITKGSVVSFLPHDNSIIDDKLPCDLRWWASEEAQTAGYSKVVVCLDKERKNNLTSAYLPVTVPVDKFSYVVFQEWAKKFLDDIYGKDNVQILK